MIARQDRAAVSELHSRGMRNLPLEAETMNIRSRIVAMGLVVAATGTAGCEMQKSLLVSCTTDKDHIDVISLDLRQQRATLLSASPPLTGTAHATPTEYEVLFQPGPDGTSRLQLKINRYTRRVTRESGPRTAEAAVVAPSTGTCDPYKAKPL